MYNILALWRSQNLIKSHVLRTANNLFQGGSQDCLREANNLRQKRNKMLKKTVPVLSVLHSIAANRKLWKTRFVCWEDSIYSYYFKSTKKSKKIYNSSERSRCYSFSLVLCFVEPRFCARTYITTSVWPSFTIPFVMFSSLVSYHMSHWHESSAIWHVCSSFVT